MNDQHNSDDPVDSTVAIRKHPLHPAIVDFPIAFYTAALLTDFTFWFTGDMMWAEFSFWLIAAGLLTGVIAFLTGLVEFMTIQKARNRWSGWLHFLLTDLAVFLSAFNLISRIYDRQGSLLFTGLGLSASTALSVLVAGFLGGRLVFHDRIGVYGVDDRVERETD
jgi:uncharacterized membrane protein